MNDLEREKPKTNEHDEDPMLNAADKASIESPPVQPGLRERVWKLLNTAQQRGPGTKQELAKDRTRSLALLIGGIVGAVLLFVGVFSTPATPPIREIGGRAAPNLGRPSAQSKTPTAPRSSVTPLLNADVASGDASTDQLSAVDIEGTSRRPPADETAGAREIQPDAHATRAPIPQAKGFGGSGLPSGVASDPQAAYRLNNSNGAPTYSYGAPVTSTTTAEPPQTSSYGGTAAAPSANRIDIGSSAKSSIIFVRSQGSTEVPARTNAPVMTTLEQKSLLPPGTRLVARLDTAATTAVKTPVVATIEYNYERDGIIVIPAGTKILGDVQQASSQGDLSIRFHTLQMPDGREEKIEGTGMGLDQKPLKGEVSGKNTGKKFVSRTLSGVGTIAAYVVGGGGGLTSTVTGETLLRDRLASNIALAGEQEFMNAAYSQNISVTVPANTRFYVVLQKPAMDTTAAAPSRSLDAVSQPAEMPTVQELRELMDLRREINRMYQESNSTVSGGTKP